MSDTFEIAIVGSGPAGLSAAGRAAARDRDSGASSPSYVLLEGSDKHARTIQRYQKGKHVMAEPGYLALRSEFDFDAGTRETILESWQARLSGLDINIRHGAEVKSIAGSRGDFTLQIAGGDTVRARNVILAIGLEGNPRKLGVEGEDLPGVQYQLDDPDAYHDEVIAVVGAGDSAIENALALARSNRVEIVNRRDEFSRAKDGNLNAVLRAISDPSVMLACHYSAKVLGVERLEDGAPPLALRLDTPEGEVVRRCHRIIARLGGIPPRAFVESSGVAFPNERPDAIPELSRTYESNVPGLYIIGSLAGYPLIKQAMNQGHDVVEYIHGNEIEPADHPLLADQFRLLPFRRDPGDVLDLFQHRIPFFSRLNALQFRELIIDSRVLVSFPDGELLEEARQQRRKALASLARDGRDPRLTQVIREGDTIYEEGDFATSFFTIVEGEVILESRAGSPPLRLQRGQFFGEGSLISGRPRLESARAGANCILVETPRRIMVKLFNSNDDVRDGVDWMFVVRELRRLFAPGADIADLREIARATTIRNYKAGAALFAPGEVGESLYVIRRGSVALQRDDGTERLTTSELRAGEIVGELALMGDPVRRQHAVATVATEVIEVRRPEFLALMRLPSARPDNIRARTAARVTNTTQMSVRPETSSLMRFLLDEGLGEATDALLIDEALCIGCDNCERACAETHQGLSRLQRAAGPSFANVHVPVSCRHCEHPHCMKDCPPNAIQRGSDGQVFIDSTCIGCGNCQVNCPYGVIRMSYDAPRKAGLLSWLFFGRGSGPGEPDAFEPDASAQERGKKAVKCDACVGDSRGYACVRACPTGAARRVHPEEFIRLLSSDGR